MAAPTLFTLVFEAAIEEGPQRVHSWVHPYHFHTKALAYALLDRRYNDCACDGGKVLPLEPIDWDARLAADAAQRALNDDLPF